MALPAGFKEIEHTADWELAVWAPDFARLLEQAARGMLAMLRMQVDVEPHVQRSFCVRGEDREALLVSFLSELLYMVESERLAFDNFEITTHPGCVEALVAGAPIKTQAKEIKAVTYHNLEIRQSREGLRVNVVFDV